ncbi:MAG: hypothetical protein U0736_05450 [Gemmataceae bacterium]
MKPQPLTAALLTLIVALLLGPQVWAVDPERSAADLRAEIESLRKKIDLLQQTVEADRKLLEDSVTVMDRIARRLEEIDRRIDRVNTTTGLRPRVSSGVSYATIRLDNRLTVDAEAIIDGVTYTVPALSQVNVPNQRERVITYQVTGTGYGLSATKVATLRAGETWTLTIY